MTGGIDAAERVLKKANEAVDRDLLEEALDDLIRRVDDWKNHRVESFGRLLLHGVFTVITGRSEQEKDVSRLTTSTSPSNTTDNKSSMRFTCSSAYSFAVKKYYRIRVRRRRIRIRLPRKYQIRTISFSLRDVYL